MEEASVRYTSEQILTLQFPKGS